MTINREKLVALLVQKTEMDQAEVESQLDELTHRITDAANRGKALEIKGLGQFYFDEDGELTFKPSDQLNKEVNIQYAGMEPVEIKPSKKKTSSVANKESSDTAKDTDEDPVQSDPDSKSDDVFGIGNAIKGSISKADSSGGDGNDTQAGDPFGKLFQKPSDVVKPQSQKGLAKAGTTPGKKSTGKSIPKQKPPVKKRDPMIMIIVIVLAVVVIAIGYIAITDYLEAPDPQPTAQESEQPAELSEPPVAAEPDLTEAEELESPDAVEDGEVADEVSSPPAEEEDPTAINDDRYGLYGEYREATGSEFTIVVHSIRNREIAEQTAQDLAQEGYRSNVTERTINEQVVYRVGIGQFESIQLAIEEAESLPEPYKNQNFIQRIQ